MTKKYFFYYCMYSYFKSIIGEQEFHLNLNRYQQGADTID